MRSKTMGDEAREEVAQTFKNYKTASERVEFLRLAGATDASSLHALEDALAIMASELARYQTAQHALARLIAPVKR